jgi:hypothetical protein
MTKTQRPATTVVLEMNETPILALIKRTTTGVSTRQRVEKSKTDSANPKEEFVRLEDVSELSESPKKFARCQQARQAQGTSKTDQLDRAMSSASTAIRHQNGDDIIVVDFNPQPEKRTRLRDCQEEQ